MPESQKRRESALLTQVAERAVRMVFVHEHEFSSRWKTIESISACHSFVVHSLCGPGEFHVSVLGCPQVAAVVLSKRTEVLSELKFFMRPWNGVRSVMALAGRMLGERSKPGYDEVRKVQALVLAFGRSACSRRRRAAAD